MDFRPGLFLGHSNLRKDRTVGTIGFTVRVGGIRLFKLRSPSIQSRYTYAVFVGEDFRTLATLSPQFQ